MRPGQVATPLLLIALASGVTLYAYVIDRGTISDADRVARQHDVFPTFRVDDITRVELALPGGSLVLDRDRGESEGNVGWTLTSPGGGREPADPGAVDALLRELEGAVRVRDVDDTVVTGLDRPRVSGSVTMGRLVLRFALGADAPRPEGAAYMRLEGEGSFVVGRSLRAQLLRGPDAYRPRALVPYGESDVTRLEVSGPGNVAFALERHGTTFRLVDGGVRADRAAVDRLFTALADARVETFVDATTAAAGLRRGAMVVTISPRNPEHGRVELRLGDGCPGQPGEVVVVRSAPTRLAACVPRSLGDALATSVAALTDASPFFAHSDELEDVRLEDLASAGSRIDLARKGSGWHERAPEDRELSSEESDSANVLAAALTNARADEVVTPKAGLARAFVARSKATVVRTGGSTTEVVELAAEGPGGTTWARRVDDGALLRLPLSVARKLQPHPVALRSRSVWRSPIDPGDVVAIESSCGGPQKLAWKDGVWTLEVPPGFAPDPIAVTEMATALARARAEAFVAESDDGTFGLSDPDACRVSITEAGRGDAGRQSAAITFGAATDGGFYARASDDPAIFVAPAALRAVSTHPVLERRRFRIERADLRSLGAVHDGQRREVHVGVDGAGALVDALAALVVHAALHPGHAKTAEGFDRPVLEVDVTYRADGGSPAVTHLTFGAAANVDGVEGYFARAAGLDATFFVLRPAVDAAIAAVAAPPQPLPGGDGGANGVGSAP